MRLFLFFLLFQVKTFAIQPEILDEMIKSQIHNRSCDKILQELIVLNISYYGFDEKLHTDGILIVNKKIQQDVKKIFDELLEIKFKIYGINPFLGAKILQDGAKKADDDYNYTGSYACRTMAGWKTKISKHAKGLAIDLNPLINPYYNTKIVIPTGASDYLNRKKHQKDDGFIDKKVILIFKKHGFDIWGGNWKNPKDYHHFERSIDD